MKKTIILAAVVGLFALPNVGKAQTLDLSGLFQLISDLQNRIAYLEARLAEKENIALGAIDEPVLLDYVKIINPPKYANAFSDVKIVAKEYRGGFPVRQGVLRIDAPGTQYDVQKSIHGCHPDYAHLDTHCIATFTVKFRETGTSTVRVYNNKGQFTETQVVIEE